MSATDLRDQLQQALGDAYVIERELGGGGMSRVFVATETSLGRRVVVKVLPAEMSGQLSVERFRREISIAARLQHAHVVPLLTAGEVGGLPYFTMPYVEGESLRSRLVRQGELPLSEAVRILREVASALAFAHAHDVVHRDIKPDNVLLSGGAAMVTDFGVAKAVDAAATSDASGITSVGVALGTPAYMAPEQASADPNVDSRADVYAWGVMAYELITGQSPFAGRTPQAMLAAHLAELPEDVTRRRSATPGDLAVLVMRCLEKRPADRPQSADELVRSLDAIGTTSGGSGQAVSRRDGAPGLRRPIALAAVVIVVLAFAIWFAQRGATGATAPSGALSLAVLPIENVGGDSAKDYLADGMTSELANALRKTPGLQVAGDLSTFRFKQARPAPAAIASQLGVRMLLTGKLQSQGGRIRLQMQLNDAGGKLLWSNKFDREDKDNFALQDEITGAIAGELRLVLTPATLAVTRAGRTANPQAHDLYLRGVFEKNKLSEQGLRRSLTYFQDALKLDANYAQAHAGMAFAYDMLADAYAPSHEYHLLAGVAAERAVRSDSLLAEARVLNGFEIAASKWDFPAGIAEMKRGLALNPDSPDALFMYSGFTGISGNTPTSVEIAERLIQLDRLSAMASLARANAFLFGGQWGEALRQDSATKKLDATVVYFDAIDAAALRELGHLNESLAAYVDFKKLTGQPSWGLAITYGRMGRRDDALTEIRALEERERHQWVDPTFIAVAYAGVGDRDHAIQWLDKAFREKAFTLRFLLTYDSPFLAPLRSDPRFTALRQRVLATTFKN